MIQCVCFSLGHPWIKEDGEAPDTPLDNAVLSRLKQFKAMNNFKKVALRVLKNFTILKEIKHVIKLNDFFYFILVFK
jgi:hypothetical protein